MEKADFEPFQRMLALVAEQYGKALSPELARLYFDGLSHLELDVVRAALNAHVRNTDVGQFMPKIADVIRAAEGGTEDAAFRALQKLDEAFRLVGAWESVAFDDPVTTAVVNDMGGWPEICARAAEEWAQFGTKEFVRRYRSYKARGDVNAAGYLPGYFERVNAASGMPVTPPIKIGRKQDGKIGIIAGSQFKKLPGATL